MTDDEYIREGIQLADFNFPWDHYRQRIANGEEITRQTLEIVELDGLAGQLMRQVDAIDGLELISQCDEVAIWVYDSMLCAHDSRDRTMGTIKVAVDSGALQQQESDG